MAEQTIRVFLCHGSSDKPFVRELYRKLREDGFTPWLDSEQLVGGQNWDFEIREAVRQSHVILVCLSNTSISKEGYVQKEISLALDIAQEKPEGTIFIIPLKLEECVVPRRLSPLHWISYFQDDGYERLRTALTKRAEQIGLDHPI